MKAGLKRVLAAAVAVSLAAAVPASAGDLSACISADEARAFSLRHLQSRLMVAGLACNQRDAYNNFVEAFRPPLADAGARLIAYFQRTGGGQAALNRHVTELANVAGLLRAENPEGFCQATWSMFLLLQDQPGALEAQAVSHVMHSVATPSACAVPAAPALKVAAGAVVRAEAPPLTTD